MLGSLLAIYNVAQTAPEIYSLAQNIIPAIHEYLDGDDPRVFSVSAPLVDEINAILPSGRALWDRQEMYLFLSAFTRVLTDNAGAVTTGWVRPREEIQNILLRGCRVPDEKRTKLDMLISQGMEEVSAVQLLRAGAGNAYSADAQPTPLPPTQKEELSRTPIAAHPRLNTMKRIAAILRPLPALAGSTIAAATAATTKHVSDVRNKGSHLKLLELIASSLDKGGLSSLESRDVLLEHGVPKEDVDRILGFNNGK